MAAEQLVDFPSGTSSGVASTFVASAAAAPAACPMAMHDACARSPEFASRSLLTHRPATIKLRLPFGIKARRGMVGTVPDSTDHSEPIPRFSIRGRQTPQ